MADLSPQDDATQGDATGQSPDVSASFDPDQSLLRAGLIDPPVRPGLVGTLDRFELLKRIGAGGMGVVYLARDSASGQRVAVKVLKPDLLAHAATVQHFLREARLMQALSHPNILPIAEVSDRVRAPYFVTPLIESGSLASRIRTDGQLDRGAAIDVVRQVAEALDYCHKRGVIHRDIKPANVLLDHDGRAYLCDLGLGQPLTASSITYVQADKRVGTAAYMAPEIVRGEAGDFRCDIYSFGAMLYEILTDQPPYSGRVAQEVFAKVRAGPPEPILSVNPKADASLALVAKAAMARELRDRYATMADVLADVNRVRAGRSAFGPRGRGKPGAPFVRRISLAAVSVCLLAGLILLAYRMLPKDTNGGNGKDTVLIDDAFGGDVLDDNTWSWGQTSGFSYQGTGKHNFTVALKDGSLLIEAKATHTRGWTAVQDVWVDSKVDLKKAGGDVRLEIEFTGDSRRGHLFVMISDGTAPRSEADPDSVRLYQAIGSHNHPFKLARRALEVDISRSTGSAVTRVRGQPSNEFQVANIWGLPAWKLRFYVSTGSAAGFPPSSGQLRISRVRARSTKPTTSVLGKVVDAVTNRPVSGAIVRSGASSTVAHTNALGMFVMPVSHGMTQLYTTAKDYEQISGPTAMNVEAGKQVIATILLRKARLRYGDASWATPFEYDNVCGLAVADDWLYFVASEGGAKSFNRMMHNGLSPARIAPLPIGGGLAFVRGELRGVSVWPGWLHRVKLDGRSSEVMQLPIQWPRGLAFDGSNLWFLESNAPESRYGAYAIDPETGEEKTHLSCRDNKIVGITIESPEDGGRLWVSSLAGYVYEVDPVRAEKTGRLEDGIIRRFRGSYDVLSYHKGKLWGVDNGAKRICIIDVRSKD